MEEGSVWRADLLLQPCGARHESAACGGCVGAAGCALAGTIVLQPGIMMVLTDANCVDLASAASRHDLLLLAPTASDAAPHSRPATGSSTNPANSTQAVRTATHTRARTSNAHTRGQPLATTVARWQARFVPVPLLQMLAGRLLRALCMC